MRSAKQGHLLNLSLCSLDNTPQAPVPGPVKQSRVRWSLQPIVLVPAGWWVWPGLLDRSMWEWTKCACSRWQARVRDSAPSRQTSIVVNLLAFSFFQISSSLVQLLLRCTESIMIQELLFIAILTMFFSRGDSELGSTEWLLNQEEGFPPIAESPTPSTTSRYSLRSRSSQENRSPESSTAADVQVCFRLM